MQRYFISLAYNGKNYVGWQIQPNGITVQEKLQNALSTILRKTIDVMGAGRTDTGVHAEKMVAHFDLQNKLIDSSELIRRLNSLLPKDIAVSDIVEVKPDAHARFSATGRTYNYYITTKKTPFFHEIKTRLFYEPNIEKMNHFCTLLQEYSDFTSFSKLHAAAKTNICKISEAYWVKNKDEYIFTITADRFLRGMVRAIVGTLLESGKADVGEDDFRNIIEQKDRSRAGNSAPAHGLFLKDVYYPDDIFI